MRDNLLFILFMYMLCILNDLFSSSRLATNSTKEGNTHTHIYIHILLKLASELFVSSVILLHLGLITNSIKVRAIDPYW